MRIEGTPLVCDAPRTAGALVFLSHAGAAGALGQARSPLSAAQVLLTQTSANLLAAGGHALGPRALVAAYGRPFALGTLRVELFPSGHGPGAASLLCESPAGRVVFTGPLNLKSPPAQTAAAEIRPADALCIDARFGAPAFRFPEPAEALAQILAFVRDVHAQGGQPVLLTAVDPMALTLARALDEQGLGVRAHNSLVRLAEIAGLAGLPPVKLQRFGKGLGPHEALLWPLSARSARALAGLPAPQMALVSGYACNPAALQHANVSAGFPLAAEADSADLLAYVKATGARQVATINDPGGDFATSLRSAGFDAYTLGPPAQMMLFTSPSAD